MKEGKVSNTRETPTQSTRIYAMDHAVSIVNNNQFEYPGHIVVTIAEQIADYITNGPAGTEEEK